MKDSSKKETQVSLQYISSFCMQISMILSSGVGIYDGLYVMSEDAQVADEKEMFYQMAEKVERGISFHTALSETGRFPFYVLRMAELGEKTGRLEDTMASLHTYYEQEDNTTKSVRNALTYPIIMIFIMLVILFVLMTKVMPIFENVFLQLGTQLPPVTRAAIEVGGALSGVSIVLLIVIMVFALLFSALGKRGVSMKGIGSLFDYFKNKSSISFLIAKRRFAGVMALMLKSGMDMDEGMTLAIEIVGNSTVKESIESCRIGLDKGQSLAEALKETKLFTSFDMQMIMVGKRTGKMESVMEELEKSYGQQADNKIDQTVARFEPTVVVVLSVAVGLILLSVMLPLMGMMSSIG